MSSKGGKRRSDPTQQDEGRHAFAHGRILVFDKSGAPTPLFSDEKFGSAGDGCAWAGMTVEAHRLPPAEFPERTAGIHLVAVHFRPATIEWCFGGHPLTKRMTPGSLDIIPQGTRLRGCSHHETEFLMMALDPRFVERVASEAGPAKPVELVRQLGIHDPQIEHIGLAIKAELETGCFSGRLYGEALAAALAARLLANYAAHVNTQPHNAGLPAYRLRRVIEYINDNLTKDLSLTEIARVAEMNPHYFSRAFRQSTGTPPHKYVLNCRVEKAKRLLAKDDLHLVEIAFRVGFQNQSHFTTLFHKLTGVTPKAFRDATGSGSCATAPIRLLH